MNYEIYCIYDKKAGLFGTPMCEINELTAKRHYEFLLTRQQELDPFDLDLYKVGGFSAATGEIEAHKPVFVCGAPKSALE